MIPDPFIKAREGADALVPGYYLIRRDRQCRVPLPVRIWWGPPLDPDTGEEMDRSPRWQVAIAGQLVGEDEIRVGESVYRGLDDFWPKCMAHPISEPDYQHRLERAHWAGLYDPNDPFGDTSAKIDPLTVTLPFCEDSHAA